MTVNVIETSMLSAFDYVWGRFTDRLAGLTDDEYFWEPVASAWSLRQDASGDWKLDGGGGGLPAPEPAPVTTIAWRVGHLAGQALPFHADGLFGKRDRLPFPGSVAELPSFLDANYSRWRSGIAAMDAADWERQLGPRWGMYAASNRLDLALHVFDEVVHHAAEVGVLRDLYAHRGSLS